LVLWACREMGRDKKRGQKNLPPFVLLRLFAAYST
jgi:hypothetical protein